MTLSEGHTVRCLLEHEGHEQKGAAFDRDWLLRTPVWTAAAAVSTLYPGQLFRLPHSWPQDLHETGGNELRFAVCMCPA